MTSTRSRAMVLAAAASPLAMVEREMPRPSDDEILLGIEACGVCRTDLHIVDGELPAKKLPLVLGDEIVGRVMQLPARTLKRTSASRLLHPRITCGGFRGRA